MKLERASILSYADLPLVYIVELGGEELVGLRDANGNFEEIDSLREVPDTDWHPVEMFGPSLGLLKPCTASIVINEIYMGSVNISIRNGKPACTAILAEHPDFSLTSSLLRQLPLARLVKEAATTALVRVLKNEEGLLAARYVEGGPGFGQLHEDLQKELATMGERTRRRVIDDEFLTRVASVYRQAVGEGYPPARAVEELFGPTTPTNARRWIAAARREGFLGPAPARGRAGERAHMITGSS